MDVPPAQVFKFVSLDSKVTFVFSNASNQVMINKHAYLIGNIIGKSNALVMDVFPINATLDNPNVPLCLKIAKHGLIDLNDEKIKYINAHGDDFTSVYEYVPAATFDTDISIANITFGKTIDICIMEKVTTTLSQVCMRLEASQEQFSFRFLNFVTQRLLEIVNNLTAAGYYYTDLKPANIGLTFIGNQVVLKLIDIDSISKNMYYTLSTYYTSGKVSPKINITRLQYLNIFFTVISMLFFDHAHIMCSVDYSKFNYDQAMRLYMNWFNPINSKQHDKWLRSSEVECVYYKYALLIGTYKIIEEYLNKPDFTMNDVLINFNEIVKTVSNVISLNQDHKSYYFEFIAQCLVVMFLIFLCSPDDIPKLVNTYMKSKLVSYQGKYFTESYISVKDSFIEPQVLIGVSIVNAMRKYITKYCNDTSCAALRKYGDYFLNTDNTKDDISYNQRMLFV